MENTTVQGAVAQLQSGVESARKSVESASKSVKKAVKSGEKKLGQLSQKAADAALKWVLAHDARVSAFRKSVKGTPIEKAFDAMLKMLKSQAGTKARKRPAKKAARRRAPAKRK